MWMLTPPGAVANDTMIWVTNLTAEEVPGGLMEPPASLAGGVRSDHIMVAPFDLVLARPMTIHIPFTPIPGTESGFVIAWMANPFDSTVRPG